MVSDSHTSFYNTDIKLEEQEGKHSCDRRGDFKVKHTHGSTGCRDMWGDRLSAQTQVNKCNSAEAKIQNANNKQSPENKTNLHENTEKKAKMTDHMEMNREGREA